MTPVCSRRHHAQLPSVGASPLPILISSLFVSQYLNIPNLAG
jgi:hypothetical protein